VRLFHSGISCTVFTCTVVVLICFVMCVCVCGFCNVCFGNTYTVCPESKGTDFLFKYLLDLPEITSDLLQSMTLGKIHSGSNVSSTVHSSTGSHFP